jgi:peptide/nickel transport system ATP-binding protein
VVHGIDLDLHPGETLAVVGESGSGKSVTAMSVLGLLPRKARVSGSLLLDGEDLLAVSPKRLRQIRGGVIGMIFQEPMTALNPVYSIGNQIVAAIRAHRHIGRHEARERAIELLRQVHMPAPEEKFGRYPHQLSGGQRQRAMIAMAIASEPKILIADEPTTALDVTVQAEILDLLRELQARHGMSIMIITHDMGVVADTASRVVVMQHGKVVETAPVADLFAAPKEDYTRTLLAAVPKLGDRRACGRGHARDRAGTGDQQTSKSAIAHRPLAAVSSPSMVSASTSRQARSSASSANPVQENQRSAAP